MTYSILRAAGSFVPATAHPRPLAELGRVRSQQPKRYRMARLRDGDRPDWPPALIHQNSYRRLKIRSP
jgi:hypothetical protein